MLKQQIKPDENEKNKKEIQMSSYLKACNIKKNMKIEDRPVAPLYKHVPACSCPLKCLRQTAVFL